MNYIKKILLLGKIGLRSPSEFMDRLEAILTSRLDRYLSNKADYKAVKPEDATRKLLDWLGGALGTEDVQKIKKIEKEVRERMELLEKQAPFTTKHHGDFSLARTCFIACRVLRPETVVETGVAYGVTTAFILKALQINEKGILHSIDLPPLGKNADVFVGYLVPHYLRERWMLHRGTSKSILPALLQELGHVDIFVHDSLHTYWNIRRELNMVTPYLSKPSVVIADDIHGNSAFLEWVAQQGIQKWFAFREEGKDSIGGVALVE